MSKAARKIIYDITYNPILEYWNWIKENEIKGKKVVSLKVYKAYKHIAELLMIQRAYGNMIIIKLIMHLSLLKITANIQKEVWAESLLY